MIKQQCDFEFDKTIQQNTTQAKQPERGSKGKINKIK
jgi:hypothetical protein